MNRGFWEFFLQFLNEYEIFLFFQQRLTFVCGFNYLKNYLKQVFPLFQLKLIFRLFFLFKSMFFDYCDTMKDDEYIWSCINSEKLCYFLVFVTFLLLKSLFQKINGVLL